MDAYWSSWYAIQHELAQRERSVPLCFVSLHERPGTDADYYIGYISRGNSVQGLVAG